MTIAADTPIAVRPRLPLALGAIGTGLLVGLIAANVWPLLLTVLGTPRAAGAEAAFLALYIWWARGGGFPKAWHAARRARFRSGLVRAQWPWAIAGAISFAITIHAAIVVLFRLIPFPVDEFRQGYHFVDGNLGLKWLAIVVSAASAGICEETGFRGYIQQPIEKRYGAFVAILISSVLFTVIHLSKDWALMGMVPIIFGAGVLLGLMAWASGSLVPTMIGHTIMDVGLFAYWWTGTAGTFSARTIAVTGIDPAFVTSVAVAVTALAITLTAIVKLRRRCAS
jgi:membrane protease YdiL (CAAX protease family)